MTTLRIEVGRCSGTTVEDVVKGLRRAGCMKYIEIDPDAMAFIPIEALRKALEDEHFEVALVPWPKPPPLPWWRRVRHWPHRVHLWGRRVFLGEKEVDQLARAMWGAYAEGDAINALSNRESPLLAKLSRNEGAPESFTLHGSHAPAPDLGPWHPICWKCRARFPNGPGQYTSKCPECGATWDGSEASDPPP